MALNVLIEQGFFNPAQMERVQSRAFLDCLGRSPFLIEINQNTFVAAENLLHTDNTLDVFFKIIFADFDFHRVVSLRMIIFGTVNEVIAASGLHTWAASGPDLQGIVSRLTGKPGVEQLVPFGTTLHISGIDPIKLGEAIDPERKPGTDWQKIPSSLEDVFIHLMDSSRDNFP